MYCSNCGEKIPDSNKFCSNCGKPTSKTEEKSELQDTKIGRWSWGAFGLSWIYLYSMRYKWWWVFLILIVITNGMSRSSDTATYWTGIIFQLAIMIILGIKGRKNAYQNRTWDNDEQFLKVQRIWDAWGLVFFLVIITIGIVAGLTGNNVF